MTFLKTVMENISVVSRSKGLGAVILKREHEGTTCVKLQQLFTRGSSYMIIEDGG